jgi:hypothetical protein
LPGIAKSWCDHVCHARPSLGRANDAVLEGLREVEAAASAEVGKQGVVDFLHHSVVGPFAMTAVAGLVGGVIRGHVVPGVAGAELPEDAIEDEAAWKMHRVIPQQSFPSQLFNWLPPKYTP